MPSEIENPASKTTLHRIDMLSRRIFRNNLKKLTLKARVAAATAKFQPDIKKLEEQIDKDSKELANLIKKYRVRLIAPGKKSFATFSAVLKFKGGSTKFKVVKPDETLALVRELGFADDVTRREVVYSILEDDLLEYLNNHPEHKPAFEGMVEWPQEKETLSVKPNAAYLTTHSSTQLSDKAIPLPQPD